LETRADGFSNLWKITPRKVLFSPQKSLMSTRLPKAPTDQSFFLFGPRGVGKTAWLHSHFPTALFFALLDAHVDAQLLAAPERLGEQIPANFSGWVVPDEIQRVPDVLTEVHRLIASRHLKFALASSSARKLRREGVNLLGGRALTRHMRPFTPPTTSGQQGRRELGRAGRRVFPGCGGGV
jgi:predicted AAA+ superfamily ATPase